jgi:Flp pilus assembly protein TadG
MRLIGHPLRRHRRSRGQALAEFSLVLLPFMMIIVALIEFSFLLTVKIGVTDTAQDAVQLAAELGTDQTSDFQVLQLVQKDVSAPMDPSKIVSVEIFKTDIYGKVNSGEDKYVPGAPFYQEPGATAPVPTVPFNQVSTGYLPSARCNTVAATVCGGVNYIGVIVTYQYSWVTPLPNLVGLGSSPPKFVQTSVSRMEPIQ